METQYGKCGLPTSKRTKKTLDPQPSRLIWNKLGTLWRPLAELCGSREQHSSAHHLSTIYGHTYTICIMVLLYVASVITSYNEKEGAWSRAVGVQPQTQKKIIYALPTAKCCFALSVRLAQCECTSPASSSFANSTTRDNSGL